MMKTIKILIALAMVVSANALLAQNGYEIRFVLDTVDCVNNTACYQTQLRSSDGTEWNLAGQNYRIFYDASKADYIDQSLSNELNPNDYFLALTQDEKDVDASASGFALPFAETLSFLNYSNDLTNLNGGGVTLPASGDWVPTTRLCFEVVDAVTTDVNSCIELVWSRPDLTEDYASAFVEVAKWVEPGTTTEAISTLYDDLGPEDGSQSCLAFECDPTNPEPETTLETCTDGIDNDNDGLIDCADNLCAQFCPSEGPLYNLSLDLASLDCAGRVACYNVQLQSSTNDAFTLGSQEYRLFYNSGVGTFRSGISLLSSDYNGFAVLDGTPTEGRDASGIGNLAYESDLGFISFGIELGDASIGGDAIVNSTAPMSTAQICFDMSSDAIDNQMVCFESDWARTNITTDYESQVTTIQEWIGINDMGPTSISLASGLDASNGDEACFNLSCPNTGTEVACGDGLDNDNDGLIDCADSDCSTAPGCEECNRAAPQLSKNVVTGSQFCDYVTGIVSLSETGGTTGPDYTTEYLLTNATGGIIQISNTPDFEVGAEGFYNVYAVNYRNDLAITGITLGANANNITSLCFQLSEAEGIVVCNEEEICNYCLGETIILDPVQGFPNTFTTDYVLTDREGLILEIVNTPTFSNLEMGIFLVYGLTYENTDVISNLTVGQNIAAITGTTLEQSVSYLLGICDQLMPNISLDLNSCEISDIATLVLDADYQSYNWSTGEMSPSIIVASGIPGTYSVTVTHSDGCEGSDTIIITGNEVSSIGDYVWEDRNLNGIQDPNENGLNGITMNLYLDANNNGIPDNPDAPVCTYITNDSPDIAEAGFYQFDVYRGNYIVEVVSGNDFNATTPNAADDMLDSDINPSTDLTPTINIGEGEVLDNVDIGLQASSSISGIVWNDTDTDGRREEGEDGIPNITVNLYDGDGNLVDTTMTTTDGNGNAGNYEFLDIPIGDYYIEVVLPDGSTLSPANVGSNDDLDSEGTSANGLNTTDTFTTQANQETTGQDFGYYEAGSICGTVWQDSDPANGNLPEIFDPGIDSVIAMSAVYLRNPNTGQVLAVTETAEDGTYCLENIPVGSYIVTFGVTGIEVDYVQPGLGSDPLNDSDVNTSTGETPIIFVGSGDVILGINAGIRLGALPIELLHFTGYWDQDNGMNVLLWTTAIEINNDRFEIERVVNQGDTFGKIGEVLGQGNSSTSTDYTYENEDIDEAGNYYYRLKQYDYDGNYSYSPIIVIEVEKRRRYVEEYKSSKIYPNPASDQLQVVFTALADGATNIAIHDMTGRKAQATNINSLIGQNLVQLDVHNLAQGSYIVRIQSGDIIEQKKLIIKR